MNVWFVLNLWLLSDLGYPLFRQTVVFKRKDSINQNDLLFLKRHKCQRRIKSLQKLFEGRKAAKSFERSFGTLLVLKLSWT